MKRCTIAICTAAFALCMLPSAFGAGTKTIKPTPADLGDLSHDYYYSWGISWTLPKGEKLKEATLTISNINNWISENNDRLFIHLLDNPSSGVKKHTDSGKGGDNWIGKGILIDTYTDTDESKPETLTYKFSSLGLLGHLKQYSKDGIFGFGFDPDCHYYNSGFSMSIETEDEPPSSVPEPSGIAALMSGLTGLGLVLRRR